MSNILTDIEVAWKGGVTWVENELKPAVLKADVIAVAATEDIQTALKSGVAQDLANVLQGIFPSVKGLPTAGVTLLNTAIPKILAAELGLEAELTTFTPANTQTFVAAVLNAFNVSADNSQLYSLLANQITTILQADTTRTFASRIKDIEAAFQDYKSDLATAA